MESPKLFSEFFPDDAELNFPSTIPLLFLKINLVSHAWQ